MSKNIAVVLSGCGFLDGAEVREAVLTLLALNTAGANVQCFAPDTNQYHVVDHCQASPNEEKRNVLVESARIARGDIRPLSELNAENYDALIFPGGFGVAKNLSTFAFEGQKATVNDSLSQALKNFHQQKKPIGAICIAPALLALTFGQLGPKLTIGNDPDTIAAFNDLGVEHQECAANEICVDEAQKFVSTPAYMYDDAELSQINQGIVALVNKVLEL